MALPIAAAVVAPMVEKLAEKGVDDALKLFKQMQQQETQQGDGQ